MQLIMRYGHEVVSCHSEGVETLCVRIWCRGRPLYLPSLQTSVRVNAQCNLLLLHIRETKLQPLLKEQDLDNSGVMQDACKPCTTDAQARSKDVLMNIHKHVSVREEKGLLDAFILLSSV